MVILLEVMDKEPSLPGIWIGSAVFGALGFYVGRRWIWPGVLLLAFELLALWGAHGELTDPFVGPAILAEAGQGYVTQRYLLSALAIAATVAGIALGARSWRTRRGDDAMDATAPARVSME